MKKTWTSLELKLAIEKGYQITKIHTALAYKRMNGLMKEYVGTFMKMKIENNGKLSPEECHEVNAYHKK